MFVNVIKRGRKRGEKRAKGGEEREREGGREEKKTFCHTFMCFVIREKEIEIEKRRKKYSRENYKVAKVTTSIK